MKLKTIVNPASYYKYFKRRAVLRNMIETGSNFHFEPLSTLLTPQYIKVGNNLFIGEKAHISAELSIGNNVMFGPRPVIVGGDHYFAIKNRSVRFLHPKNRENSNPIHIEDEVWCGASVIIMGGVTIGMGAVVGAGSIITKSIPPYTVAFGNPCKVAKKIFSNTDLSEHLSSLGYSSSLSHEIISRRQEFLDKMGSFKIINRTSDYWEFK